MPEEFDKDDLVEHSNISDKDLFNMTSAILKNDRLKGHVGMDLMEVDEKNSTLSKSETSDSSASSTLLPASSVLNGLFTTNNLYSKPEDTFKKVNDSSNINMI